MIYRLQSLGGFICFFEVCRYIMQNYESCLSLELFVKLLICADHDGIFFMVCSLPFGPGCYLGSFLNCFYAKVVK